MTLFLLSTALLVAGCKQPQHVLEPTLPKSNDSEPTDPCTTITDQQLKQTCIITDRMTRAMDELNLSLCDDITNPEIATTCKDNVRLQLARNTNNQNLCNEIERTHIREICNDALN